jgi:hypothetical protein
VPKYDILTVNVRVEAVGMTQGSQLMLKFVLAAALAGTALTSAHAQSAAAGEFGSAAFLSRRNCNGLATEVNCLGPANPDSNRKETYIPGGPGETVDFSIRPGGGGKLVARVEYGELDLPTIKAGAWAGDDNRIGSTVVSYMRYRYTGPTSIDYGIDAVIDWTTSGAPLFLANGDGGSYGGEGSGVVLLWMYNAAAFPKLASAGAMIDFPIEKSCGSAGVLGYSEFDLSRATAGAYEGAVSLATGCDGNPLRLDPGDNFVIMAVFQAIANRGGFLDATNTIRVRLSEALPAETRKALAEQLVSSRATVPEPASWAMLIIGFGAVGATLRGQRRPATA